MSTTVEVFERTDEQRMVALAKANRVRVERAVLKRELKAGRVDVRVLLADPPALIDSMKVFSVLVALPKFGRVKAARVLNECRISQSKTVGGMSDRQRGCVIAALGERSVT